MIKKRKTNTFLNQDVKQFLYELTTQNVEQDPEEVNKDAIITIRKSFNKESPLMIDDLKKFRYSIKNSRNSLTKLSLIKNDFLKSNEYFKSAKSLQKLSFNLKKIMCQSHRNLLSKTDFHKLSVCQDDSDDLENINELNINEFDLNDDLFSKNDKNRIKVIDKGLEQKLHLKSFSSNLLEINKINSNSNKKLSIEVDFKRQFKFNKRSKTHIQLKINNSIITEIKETKRFLIKKYSFNLVINNSKKVLREGDSYIKSKLDDEIVNNYKFNQNSFRVLEIKILGIYKEVYEAIKKYQKVNNNNNSNFNLIDNSLIKSQFLNKFESFYKNKKIDLSSNIENNSTTILKTNERNSDDEENFLKNSLNKFKMEKEKNYEKINCLKSRKISNLIKLFENHILSIFILI